MTNPVLVTATRGNLSESKHRGAICVTDADGKTVYQCGDVDQPVFPRSAIKSMQALALIESGAADRYVFTDAQIALACSSHSGEPEHIATAETMLAAAGLDETALECGGHWSSHPRVLVEQARRIKGEPTAICNNCSGKHSGFLCTAVHQGIEPAGYISPNHAIQQYIKGILEHVTGALHQPDQCGIDGCSIPTYATPLKNLSHGFAKMGTGVGFELERAKAAKRILAACMAEPFYVAGSNRFCTRYMTLGAGHLFAKTGAEGVFCGAIPDLGLGIALKCDDGGSRAAEVIMAGITRHLLSNDDPLQASLAELADTAITNWNAIETGRLSVRLPKSN